MTETPTASSLSGTPFITPEQLDQVAKLEKQARFDLDVRGVIAILTVGLFFAFAITQFVMTRQVKLPAELVALPTLIMTFYFAQKSSNGPNNK